jgi:DNA-binding XRE family transcriptional regulator
MFVKQHRLPLDKLVRFCGTTNKVELAERCGVARETIMNWEKDGGVPDQKADHIAVSFGVHPSAIWGDEWFELADKVVV